MENPDKSGLDLCRASNNNISVLTLCSAPLKCASPSRQHIKISITNRGRSVLQTEVLHV